MQQWLSTYHLNNGKLTHAFIPHNKGIVIPVARWQTPHFSTSFGAYQNKVDFLIFTPKAPTIHPYLQYTHTKMHTITVQ